MANKSIIATATITNKSVNQDSKREISTSLINAVLVADGLGSYKYAEQSSILAIEAMQKQLEVEDVDYLDFNKLFRISQESLIELAKQVKREENYGSDNLFGTTLIVLVETEKKIKIAYVGNGAIWHIRGNFDEFSSIYSFPWSAVNLLNPHTVEERGKEALYRLISDRNTDCNEYIPSIIEIEKDSYQGDIFMICSDGIYSEDQRIFGRNSTGVWVKYDSSMRIFFEHLKCFFEKIDYSSEKLHDALIQYLKEIKTDLDDDATLGVLITKSTLEYQLRKRTNINEDNTDK
ncbi:hypothetical protein AGMMS49574_01840 [Bacteroidia bacterium]|nr:hypothetical protein AGMMS49574_01840 [Bacteroidia bacterium]